MQTDTNGEPGVDELRAVAADFVAYGYPDLLARWDDHQRYWQRRREQGLDPHEMSASAQRGGSQVGVDFAVIDPLGLASHPALRDAAIDAIQHRGLQPAPRQRALTAALSAQLADILKVPSVTLFPSGWAAAFGAIRTVVHREDHVVLDAACHPAFAEAAALATGNVLRTPHCDVDAIERRLAEIRFRHPSSGVLVVTHGVFALESTHSNLARLHALCRAYAATLLVNVAEDFGIMGAGGLGSLAEHGVLGAVDIVTGSLSRACATSGGFVASTNPALGLGLSVFASTLTHPAVLSPAQVAVALAALRLIGSAEGDRRRRSLAANALRLRQRLAAQAFRIPGELSPIVPLRFNTVAEGRLATREAVAQGARVSFLEHPQLPRLEARWLLRPRADHTADQIDRMAEVAAHACEQSKAALARLAVRPL